VQRLIANHYFQLCAAEYSTSIEHHTYLPPLLPLPALPPLSGQVIKEEPERQPIVPELALSLGPLMSMISGQWRVQILYFRPNL
jgi:hypothetical protein